MAFRFLYVTLRKKKKKEEGKKKKKTLVAGTRISINLPEIYLNEKEFEKVFIQDDFFPPPPLFRTSW